MGKYGAAKIDPEVVQTNPYEKTAKILVKEVKAEDFYGFWASIAFWTKK